MTSCRTPWTPSCSAGPKVGSRPIFRAFARRGEGAGLNRRFSLELTVDAEKLDVDEVIARFIASA